MGRTLFGGARPCIELIPILPPSTGFSREEKELRKGEFLLPQFLMD